MDKNRDFRPFREDTLKDAFIPIRERFGDAACRLAEKHLHNPLRSVGDDTGTIGYRKGNPVSFQVACLRRLYFAGREILGIVGGLTCRTRKGCPPSVTFETMERAMAPRKGSVMSFGNTCCTEMATMNEGTGGIVGPQTCAQYRWRAIRPLECLTYFVRRKLFKASVPKWVPFSTLGSMDFRTERNGVEISRMATVDPEFFDRFMDSYVRENRGLVCSRTAAEIKWIFGERVKNGRCVMLGARQNGQPVGYVVLTSGIDAKRWLLADWIALRNDPLLLDALVSAACQFLRKNTPAMMLESTGYSDFANQILRKCLPHVRPVCCNQFSWGVSDAHLLSEIKPVVNGRESWFFGPYDGDLCM